MAINLANAQRKVEEFMTETCDVYAPVDVHAGVVDPITLALITPAASKLYNAGACKIKDIPTNSRGAGVGDSEGGNQLLIVVTEVDFPLADVPTSGFPEGSLIICRSSLRMPQMVGAVYQMRQSVLKTFGIQYSVLADRRKRVDP